MPEDQKIPRTFVLGGGATPATPKILTFPKNTNLSSDVRTQDIYRLYEDSHYENKRNEKSVYQSLAKQWEGLGVGQEDIREKVLASARVVANKAAIAAATSFNQHLAYTKRLARRAAERMEEALSRDNVWQDYLETYGDSLPTQKMPFSPQSLADIVQGLDPQKYEALRLKAIPLEHHDSPLLVLELGYEKNRTMVWEQELLPGQIELIQDRDNPGHLHPACADWIQPPHPHFEVFARQWQQQQAALGRELPVLMLPTCSGQPEVSAMAYRDALQFYLPPADYAALSFHTVENSDDLADINAFTEAVGLTLDQPVAVLGTGGAQMRLLLALSPEMKWGLNPETHKVDVETGAPGSVLSALRKNCVLYAGTSASSHVAGYCGEIEEPSALLKVIYDSSLRTTLLRVNQNPRNFDDIADVSGTTDLPHRTSFNQPIVAETLGILPEVLVTTHVATQCLAYPESDYVAGRARLLRSKVAAALWNSKEPGSVQQVWCIPEGTSLEVESLAQGHYQITCHGTREPALLVDVSRLNAESSTQKPRSYGDKVLERLTVEGQDILNQETQTLMLEGVAIHTATGERLGHEGDISIEDFLLAVRPGETVLLARQAETGRLHIMPPPDSMPQLFGYQH